MFGEDSAFAAALGLPLVVSLLYYILARPLYCTRCRGQNLGIKFSTYRCRHCGAKLNARNY